MKRNEVLKNYLLPGVCALFVLIYLYNLINQYVFMLNNTGRPPVQDKWFLLTIAIIAIPLLVGFIITKKMKLRNVCSTYILTRINMLVFLRIFADKEMGYKYEKFFDYILFGVSPYRNISIVPDFFIDYCNSLVISVLVCYFIYLFRNDQSSIPEKMKTFKKYFLNVLPVGISLECILFIVSTQIIIFIE